mgnify:CR=1 FL=1
MARIDISSVREILTGAERRLVISSGPKQITKLTADQLKSNIGKARKLRDKWRDVYQGQRRKVQQSRQSRVGDENERSRKKGDIFGEVAVRFEKQLKKVESSAGSDASRKSAATKTPKSARAKAHRQSRTQTREQLKEEKKAVARRRTVKKAVEEVKAKPARESEPPAPERSPKSSSSAKVPIAVKGTRTKANVAKTTVKKTPVGSISAKLKKQRPAKAAAKNTRLKLSGIDTRVRGHVSARGKRNQARRDRAR